MTTFTLFRFLTVKEDSIRSYVACIVDNPIVFSGISHSFWFNSALKSKSVISTIELKTFSVLFCSLNVRSAVNSYPYCFTSFSTLTMLISLRLSFNKAVIHNIRDNLMHDLIILDTNTVIGNIPLARVIIWCQPTSMRLWIFSYYLESYAVPIIRRLGIVLSVTPRSSLKNAFVEIIHISSRIKVFLW